MTESQLMQFESHVGGMRARVIILSSRVQWTVQGHQQVIRMLPLWAISSVTTRKSLARKSTLTVSSNAGVIEFRVDRAIAQQAENTLNQIVARQESPELDDSRVVGRGSIADELASLTWLRDMGVLTATEFDEQSRLLLSFSQPPHHKTQ